MIADKSQPTDLLWLNRSGGSTAGVSSFQVTLTPDAFDGAIAQFGTVTVVAKPVALNDLTAQEQAGVAMTLTGGATLMAALQIDAGALGVTGFHTEQGVPPFGWVRIKVQLAGARCRPGPVTAGEILDGQGVNMVSDLVGDNGANQTVTGTITATVNRSHYVFYLQCPGASQASGVVGSGGGNGS